MLLRDRVNNMKKKISILIFFIIFIGIGAYFYKHYNIKDGTIKKSCEFKKKYINFEEISLKTGGAVSKTGDKIVTKFTKRKKDNDVYIIKLLLNSKKVLSGSSIDIKISNWKNVSYVAFGLMQDDKYKHIKIKNFRQNVFFSAKYSVYDYATMIQDNNLESKQFESDIIEVFIKGEPSEGGGVVELQNLTLENKPKDYIFFVNDCKRYFETDLEYLIKNNDIKINNVNLKKLLFKYDEEKNPEYSKNIKYYTNKKKLPLLNGNVFIDIKNDNNIYDSIKNDISQRYSYQALNHVNSFLMGYEKNNNKNSLKIAKKLTEEWIKNNFSNKTQDGKYMWYDHGVAERQMVLLRLFYLGEKAKLDSKFLAQILIIIKKQADLLADESFYSKDQNYRYHNHGIFQDIALLITANFFPNFVDSDKWQQIAIERVTDQFNHLTKDVNGYAASLENSSAYHDGTMSVLNFLVSILKSINYNSDELDTLLEHMHNFSKLITYPNGVLPAIGDSNRNSNLSKKVVSNRKLSNKKHVHKFVGLDSIGYIVAKGSKNSSCDFQFIQTATSLNKTHKHADNLSFTLFYDGIEWFIDPSFFSHQYLDPFPAYFRGPFAHNAIAIHGLEYRNKVGVANIKSEFNKEKEVFIARGSNYAYDKCDIRRTVNGTLKDLQINVNDFFSCDKNVFKGVGSIMFQLGETVIPEIKGDVVLLQSKLSSRKLKLKLPNCSKVNIYNGNKDPIFGWTATGFRKKEKIYSIECIINQDIDYKWSIEDVDK